MEDILEQIYVLVKKKMKEQGAYDREAYKNFVVETIEYFNEKGKIDDDENEEWLKNQLMLMWEDAENELTDSDK